MNNSSTRSKKEVRDHFLRIRGTLLMDERSKASSAILKKLKECDEFKNAETIHTYASMSKNGEVDTFPLMESILSAGKRLVVPAMNRDGSLSHRAVRSTTQLKPNSWGVPEPVAGQSVKPTDLDLVIVPMVAADYQKNRIGYGKGYYDRFLENCDAFRAGLCYSCTLSWVPLPAESFDQPMNYVVTDYGILR